ncbi:hypothetical protein CKAH01_14161 [Colletotrichum kahawae]|uniref:Uncharacterized protein n=1 Tax=Colletotrichum kahawae TaxID=34407 RepID=A0AAD9YN36_COLKA|nr:hypothetical protein CKAH01_14161 [Colletotrichum kahawae]
MGTGGKAQATSTQDWMNGSPPKLRPFQKGGASPGQVLLDGDAQRHPWSNQGRMGSTFCKVPDEAICHWPISPRRLHLATRGLVENAGNSEIGTWARGKEGVYAQETRRRDRTARESRDRERGEQPSQGGCFLQLSSTTTRRMEFFQRGAPPFAPRVGAIVECWGLRQAAVSLPVSAKTAALLSEGLQEEDGPGVRSMLMEGQTLSSPVPALRVPPEEPGFQLSRGRLQL